MTKHHLPDKLVRLSHHIRAFINELTSNNTIPVHHTISQSYYMQKAEELAILQEQMKRAQKHLNDVSARASVHYREIYLSWSRDVRWLQKHVRAKQDLSP